MTTKITASVPAMARYRPAILMFNLLISTASASTLVDNGDGTITDIASGLHWEQAPSVDSELWDAATAYCGNLSLGSKNGWRLPGVKELSSIVDSRAVSPSIDIRAFPSTIASYYWTSTVDASDPLKVWIVLFDGTFVTSTTLTNARLVRCVHD